MNSSERRPPTTPRSLKKGLRTRQDILRHAVDLGSTEGLEGLTIGRLAARLNMSKSGLFAHFGSKEELQLATVEAARKIFLAEVVEPARRQPPGRGRLEVLLQRWLAYMEEGVFRGGCFFAAAASEFDGRPGRVRDRIAALLAEWQRFLTETIAEAQEAGALADDRPAAQIAFEVHAFVQEANWSWQLWREPLAYQRARAALERTLRRRAQPRDSTTPLLPPLPAGPEVRSGSAPGTEAATSWEPVFN